MDLSNKADSKSYKVYFVQCCKDVCPGFEITEDNKPLLNDIFNWCICANGNLDYRKGLWLYGNIGTGKSTMLQIIKKFCTDVRGRDSDGYPVGTFRTTNAAQIAAEYAKNGIDGIQTYIDSNKQAFDELGSESSPAGYFGNQLNVMQHILQMRYDKRCWSITHVTTNLTIEEIAERYEARIYDRCKEMFNFVEMSGKTFRKF